nr:DUF234 domain-containing protein [Haloferax larsenii]
MPGSRLEGIRRGTFEPYSSVGRLWYGEDEIDIVGLEPNDDRILLAECKWTSEPVGEALGQLSRPTRADTFVEDGACP